MQWLAAAIGGVFLNITASLVGRVLVALGLGVASYTGFSGSISWLKSSAVTALLSLPPDVVGMLSLMRVGSCISMVFSALLVRLALQGMQSDTVKSWVKK